MSRTVNSTLRDEELGDKWVHVCVDMQRLFEPGSEWGLSWMPKVLPNIVRLCQADPDHTVFTRFIPAAQPGQGQGQWRRYYTRWADMTLERVGREAIQLVSALQQFCPPAMVLDKAIYSPWLGADLHRQLQARDCDTLLVSGGETEMCVLATVLGAADLGYRTIVVRDALCSASDESHEAVIQIFTARYSQQVETAETDEILHHLS